MAVKMIYKKKCKIFQNKEKKSSQQSTHQLGSSFKRQENIVTAKLIDQCGLKGYSIGGAKVSEKHAGFIINYNNATAKDVLELIKYIKEEVYKKFGIKIEEERKVIGEQ